MVKAKVENMNLSQKKIELLKSHLPDFQGATSLKQFNITGIEVRFYLYGTHQEKILHFFDDYFKYFPSKKNEPQVTIHYLSPNNEFSNPVHAFWDEDDWQYHVERTEKQHWISQRDFTAYLDLKTKEYWALGPILDHACCDSTDNLVQYALGEELIHHHILPLHAATITDGKAAYVFFGESGAGKSTLAGQCYELDGFKILSGDQIYLKFEGAQLFAYPNTTTIADFPRRHPGWAPQACPVRAITHLLKIPRKFTLKSLEFKDILPLILRETVFRQEAIKAQSLLELILKLEENKEISLAEMSYLKGESFLARFLSHIEKV